uniref:Sulfotransferase n=1 Tax=Gopherus agassizii TaxID=38772 RepID=A0A452GV17_9SAUR
SPTWCWADSLRTHSNHRLSPEPPAGPRDPWHRVVSGPLTFSSLGTNWMREILSLIRSDGDPGWVRSVLNWDRAPWVESRSGLEAALKYPPPRLLCSHLPIHLFPKSLQRSKAKVRGSRVWRILFLSEGGKVTNHPLHGSGCLPQDLQGSVRRICHFLGKELSEEQVAAVVENASFQSMKGNKMSNFSQLPDEYMDHQKGELLRKGICGDWKNHLSEAQSQRFDTVYQEQMQGLGLTFPWD